LAEAEKGSHKTYFSANIFSGEKQLFSFEFKKSLIGQFSLNIA
jgi:hypothetical protein